MKMTEERKRRRLTSEELAAADEDTPIVWRRPPQKPSWFRRVIAWIVGHKHEKT